MENTLDSSWYLNADNGGRCFESLIFIIIQGAGKRMVVDRQNIINKVRVQEVQSGRQALRSGRRDQSNGRQGSKPGGLGKAS